MTQILPVPGNESVREEQREMESEEVGLAELLALVRRSWRWIVLLAAGVGIATFLYLAFWLPPIYTATASLVIRPPLRGSEGGELNTVGVYRQLVESDSILRTTEKKLVSAGELEADTILETGRNLFSSVEPSPGQGGPASPMINLTGMAETPEKAMAIANAWATALLEESGEMVPAAASEAEAVVAAQVTPTRQEIEQLETRRIEIHEDYNKREETISVDWDRRIGAKRKEIEETVAQYQADTRQLMEEMVANLEVDEAEDAAGGRTRAKLLEIASVRAQLAQTPRVLRLEKAASDETLAELLARGNNPEGFDNTLVSQEVNLLYDQLAVRALTLEGELKNRAAGNVAEVSGLLLELERVQLTRSSGLVSILEDGDVDLKIFRRRRSRQLDDLRNTKVAELAKLNRDLERLKDLESRLGQRLNSAIIARLMGEVEPIRLAAPAVLSPSAQPRQVPIRVALATFLGGLLGLMLALFRSAGPR
jgi:uncharacterized protein involved in exopolysaccharide biosynthesis